jgi:hypothetical protein
VQYWRFRKALSLKKGVTIRLIAAGGVYARLHAIAAAQGGRIDDHLEMASRG